MALYGLCLWVSSCNMWCYFSSWYIKSIMLLFPFQPIFTFQMCSLKLNPFVLSPFRCFQHLYFTQKFLKLFILPFFWVVEGVPCVMAASLPQICISCLKSKPHIMGKVADLLKRNDKKLFHSVSLSCFTTSLWLFGLPGSVPKIFRKFMNMHIMKKYMHKFKNVCAKIQISFSTHSKCSHVTLIFLSCH